MYVDGATLLNVCTVGRSVKEHDRSELLHQAEPIDYSGGVATSSSVFDRELTSGLYQGYGDAGPHRPPAPAAAAGPRRGFFDDVWV